MKAYKDFLKSRSSQRVANNKHIRGAMRGLTPKTADLIFDLSMGEKGKKLDINRRANVKAMELVSDLIGSFGLPMRPQLQYQGMIKNATDQNGDITDGIVRVGVVLRTLMGHKTHIDVPVIVRESSLLEPAVFFYEQAPYVLCGPALEELVRCGGLTKEVNQRSMYQPPVDGAPIHPDDLPRQPVTNTENMFSPGARSPWTFRRNSAKDPKLESWKNIDKPATKEEWRLDPEQRDEHVKDWMNLDKKGQKERPEPRKRTNIDTPTEFPELWPEVPEEYLDTAERTREGLIEPGSNVTLQEDVQARERGGGYIVVPSGEKGQVLKDMEGDGKLLYVNFEALCLSTVVPTHLLKSAAATPDQVQYEVRQMLREGYQEVDIKDAIKRKYPDQANQALANLK